MFVRKNAKILRTLPFKSKELWKSPLVFSDMQRKSFLTVNTANTGTQTAIYSWGIGTQGQLGHAKFETSGDRWFGIFSDDTYFQQDPRRMLKSKSFRKLACGSEFTIALNSSGQLFGWGKTWGLGNKAETATLQPTLIDTDNINMVDISAGSNHCAAIDSEGRLYTMGSGKGWVLSKSSGGYLGHNSSKSVDKPK
jgi:alpha-tubulin suppressor-like RCC1 family protein